MKLATLSSIVLGASTATACFQAHTYMSNCFVDGDYVSLTLWDDGNQVIRETQEQHSASSSSTFSFSGNGYTAYVTGNGADITVHAPNSYWYTLAVVDNSGENSFVCAQTDDTTYYGSQYEYTQSDNNSDCRNYQQPGLCDYRDFC